MRSNQFMPNRSGHLEVMKTEYRDAQPNGKKPSRRIMCLCRCVCGKELWVRGDRIRSGRSKSCGCRFYEGVTTHGKSSGNIHQLYGTWSAMIGRCCHPRHKMFPSYGGRGITVCERWKGRDGFDNFLADMGPKPDGYSIDRIDNDKGYSPDNCRWADRITQQGNTRTTKLLTHDGRTQSVSAWARELKMSPQSIFYRIEQGWPVERILTQPKRKYPELARPAIGKGQTAETFA